MTRRLSGSWIDAFCAYTEGTSSPLLFRRWAAIACVAGALERKVWCRSKRSNLYPNMFIVLVGPAGVGKTTVTDIVRQFWTEIKGLRIAASNVSRASLSDQLRDADRKIVLPQNIPSVVSFNSLQIVANELSVFLPSFENDFMGILTDLYDCKYFAEKKRTKELDYVIQNPQINLLAATTPSYLNSLLPEGAWEQGFTSRTLFVFSGDTILGELFPDEEGGDATTPNIIKDLEEIFKLYGKFQWESKATNAIQEWYKAKGPPIPDHPKLFHYTTRRTAHLIKLCMIASAARSDDLIITLENYQEALGWLLDAEASMPEIFKAMASGGDRQIMDDTWYYVYKLYVKEKHAILQSRVIDYMSRRVPAFKIASMLQALVSAGILKQVIDLSGTCYIPQPRKED